MESLEVQSDRTNPKFAIVRFEDGHYLDEVVFQNDCLDKLIYDLQQLRKPIRLESPVE